MNLLFMDFETGGLDPKRHAPLQFAYIIEHDGEVVKEAAYDIRPDRNDDICMAAIETNYFTLERMRAGKDLPFVLLMLKMDCLPFPGIFPVGHNVQFDIDFLRRGCERHHENMFLYLDIKKNLDTRAIAQFLSYKGGFPKPTENFKLETLCTLFEIPLKAHDALEDIRATRTLFHILEKL